MVTMVMEEHNEEEGLCAFICSSFLVFSTCWVTRWKFSRAAGSLDIKSPFSLFYIFEEKVQTKIFVFNFHLKTLDTFGNCHRPVCLLGWCIPTYA